MISNEIQTYPGTRKYQTGLRLSLLALLLMLPALSAQEREKLAAEQQAPPSSPAPPLPQNQGKPQPAQANSAPYNPLPAEKDVEVGTYYMRKGDLDAAIPRFEEAIQLRPDWGKPRLLLAELYEKKHDPGSAVKYYKEYLQVYPHAPDAERIQKKIEKLARK